MLLGIAHDHGGALFRTRLGAFVFAARPSRKIAKIYPDRPWQSLLERGLKSLAEVRAD